MVVLNPPVRKKKPVKGCLVEMEDATAPAGHHLCGRTKSKHSTKFCPWHRLLRLPGSSQDDAALSRQKRQQAPGTWQEGDVFCTSCLWYVPGFFMGKGTRCVGCERMAAHRSHVERTYELSKGEWQKLYRLQRGRCATCRRKQNERRLATDHDHETGRVRGLLCLDCNERVLGGLGGKTSVALPRVRAMLAYLETPPADGAWRPPEDVRPADWARRVTGYHPVTGQPIGQGSDLHERSESDSEPPF